VRYAIVGTTLTGNMGGSTMLCAALDELQRLSPGCDFELLSIYPRQDRKSNRIPNLRIVSTPPLLLVGVWFPLALFVWPLARFRVGRTVLSLIPIYRSLIEASVVVDLAGIAFVDGRGVAILLYNLACTVPAILFGKKIAKLSQALGPFRRPINAWCAGRVLSRCAVVVGRGERTGKYLHELGLNAFHVLPDTSFALQVSSRVHDEARNLLAAQGVQGRQLLLVSPSQVVAQYCAHAGVDYYGVMAAFVEEALVQELAVALLPHSTARGASRNNDIDVCQRLGARVSTPGLIYFGDDYGPRTLRALIGSADLFVGSRFHGMVSALAGGVPLIVIAWSHKYREVLDMFGLTEWAIDWKDLALDTLLKRFEKLVADAPGVRRQIQAKLPVVVAQARKNFELARGLVDDGPG